MALANQYGNLALDATLQKLVDRRSAMGSANLVSGSQNRLREPWNSIDNTKWTVATSNMTASSVSGNLQIAMGTVANATASLTSVMTFSAPARIQVSMALSQKIANNTIYLELVGRNAANTAQDETMLAQWRISGNDSTSATNAVYYVQNGAYSTASAVASTPVVSHTGTTPTSIFEIEFKSSEVWFHSRQVDVMTGRANSYLRNSMSPNPMIQYNFRIRAVNGSTAPASATTAYIGMTMIQDYTEVNTEITGSRGTSQGADALPVVLTASSAAAGNVGINFLPPLPSGTNLLGYMKIQGQEGNTSVVKAASTAPVASDPALVVTQSPNSSAIPASQIVTTVSSAATAVTLTIPAPASGFRNYITGVWFERYMTAAGTASGTSIVSTASNTGIVFNLPSDAAAQGTAQLVVAVTFASAIASTSQATATTLTAPAVTSTIYRISASYYVAP